MSITSLRSRLALFLGLRSSRWSRVKLNSDINEVEYHLKQARVLLAQIRPETDDLPSRDRMISELSAAELTLSALKVQINSGSMLPRKEVEANARSTLLAMKSYLALVMSNMAGLSTSLSTT